MWIFWIGLALVLIGLLGIMTAVWSWRDLPWRKN